MPGEAWGGYIGCTGLGLYRDGCRIKDVLAGKYLCASVTSSFPDPPGDISRSGTHGGRKRARRHCIVCTRRLKDVAESVECVGVAVAVEHRPTRGPRAEDAIKKEEGDAEVLVHEAIVVESPVMDVVSFASQDEPSLQTRSALHPEVVDVHAVVEVADHEEAPGERSGDEDGLMQHRHVEEVEHGDGCDDQQGAGDEPFEADVVKRDGVGGGVVITGPGPLRLKRPVKHQVMPHVTAAEESDLSAVQKPMQEVSKEFGDQNRGGEPAKNWEYAFHGRKVSRFAEQGQATSGVSGDLSEDAVRARL